MKHEFNWKLKRLFHLRNPVNAFLSIFSICSIYRALGFNEFLLKIMHREQVSLMENRLGKVH